MDSAYGIDPDQPAHSAQANPDRLIPSQGIEIQRYRVMIPERETPYEAKSVCPGQPAQHAQADPDRYFTQSLLCWFSRGTAYTGSNLSILFDFELSRGLLSFKLTVKLYRRIGTYNESAVDGFKTHQYNYGTFL